MDIRERLIKYNTRGLIAGPEESEETFFIRCKSIQSTSPPLSFSLAKKMFDIDPDWISINYTNKKLRFWEGGCTWIEPNKVVLQLNKAFKEKETYLGLYTRDELIAHELVHVARLAFEEPIFEEILAYSTSPSHFRRFFGPFFRTSKGSRFLLIGFLACLGAAFFSFFVGVAYLCLFGLIGFNICRLLRAQYIFSRTQKKLIQLVGAERALPIMIRLTDREIIRFSKKTKEQILAFAQKMSKNQLRWKQIYYAYFETPA
ncbi:MAG: hypothetical protein WAM28_05230 [Chlamydiales bacterium]